MFLWKLYNIPVHGWKNSFQEDTGIMIANLSKYMFTYHKILLIGSCVHGSLQAGDCDYQIAGKFDRAKVCRIYSFWTFGEKSLANE